MNRFQDILKGGDLRSIGRANEIVLQVKDQKAFDELFQCLSLPDRKVVMRAANAIEKITIKNPELLEKHKTAILTLCKNAREIELKWHLALIVSRLNLTNKELKNAWDLLRRWATEGKESKIVKVNAIQGLYDLLQQYPGLSDEFNSIVSEISKENIASLNARIRKIGKGRHSNG